MDVSTQGSLVCDAQGSPVCELQVMLCDKEGPLGPVVLTAMHQQPGKVGGVVWGNTTTPVCEEHNTYLCGGK